MGEEAFYYNEDMRTGERRKFVRLKANFMVSYHVQPEEISNSDMTLTRNVSLGGVCFTVDKAFKYGTILHVSLRLPKISRAIEFLGEVVYSTQEKGKNSIYDIGLKFVQANDEDLYILQNIIKNCASSDTKIMLDIYERRKDSDETN